MDLATLWFMVIALFWLGFLFLEGFDLGVGMLLPVVGRDEEGRSTMLGTIGPVWDGNEVWLIVAAGATFAAFPGWYAALFSGAYLVVVVVLLALIGRGVAIEYRAKVASARWRRCWDVLLAGGSAVAAVGVGMLLSATVFGLPIGPDGDRVGGAFAAVRWETLLGGLAVAGFAVLHGAVFVALKTDGAIRIRARRLAQRAGPVALLPLAALLVLVQLRAGSPWTWVPVGVALAAAVTALPRLAAGREGQAFAALGVVIAAAVVALFGALHPNVLVSTVDARYSLPIAGTAVSHYTLTVMTWLAAFVTPVVLAYQGWSYWVFRRRITGSTGAGAH